MTTSEAMIELRRQLANLGDLMLSPIRGRIFVLCARWAERKYDGDDYECVGLQRRVEHRIGLTGDDLKHIKHLLKFDHNRRGLKPR